MCGIAGIFDPKSKSSFNTKTLKRMADKIVHRGPDDDGYFVDSMCGLAFRRLSIVDLSTAGNQPFYNEDKSIVSVTNGEIYNYPELRKDLLAKGHKLNSNCDTEIINHLYEEYGDTFVEKLDGQFAVALYDKNQQSLLLARDFVGVAPLFWTKHNGVIYFASEIKAILANQDITREIDLTSLDSMFTFPSIVSPRTMFKGIHALKPGHILKIHSDEAKELKYYDLDYPQEIDLDSEKSVDEHIENIDFLLGKAVKKRLQADVPVGCYISGGLDSSIISSLTRKELSNRDLNSYSILFDDNKIDERKYQRMMSQQIASNHNEIEFDWQSISNYLQKAVYHAETPLKETYNTCSLALSEKVNDSGLKVILTGEGADEIFAGYVGYRLDLEREPEELEPEIIEDQVIREGLWGDSQFIYERSFIELNELKNAIYGDNIVSSLNDFNAAFSKPVNKEYLQGRHINHKRSYLDFKLRISDHLVADHGDRVTFANSIEGRYPFLDKDLLDYTRKIHPKYLIENGIEKSILKKYAAKIVPDEIRNREKFAFVAPGSQYLLQHNYEFVSDYLSYNSIKSAGYFNPSTIERLKKMYLRPDFSINQTFENDILMIVLTFNILLEQYKI